MKQTLYGDVLFFVNFTMDFLTLFITAEILHRSIRPLRLSLSAAVGAVYGVAACFMGGMLIFRIAINVAVSFLMCYIAFGKKILPCCALFYGTGCLLGGVMTALFGMINRMSGTHTVYVDGQYRTVPSDIPLGWMAVVAVITGAAAIAGGRYEKRKRSARDISFTVRTREGSKTFLGICDSGNLLTDPASGRPVIILTKKALLSLLPEPLIPFFEEGDITKMPSLPPEYLRLIRLIPAESVGGSCMLIGFVPQAVLIAGIEKAAVLASGDELRDFGGSEALIPSILCMGW